MADCAQIELILGGARSGKSRLAEQRAVESGMNVVYVATATGDDDEMIARIEQHKRRRDKISGDRRWSLIEQPVHLAEALQSIHGNDTCVLVDCLTLWLSNCLQSQCWELQRSELFSVLPKLSGKIIFVSNEVGLGIVPLGSITRKFVDESGLLHQELANCCDSVTLTVAGMPLELKTYSNCESYNQPPGTER